MSKTLDYWFHSSFDIFPFSIFPFNLNSLRECVSVAAVTVNALLTWVIYSNEILAYIWYLNRCFFFLSLSPPFSLSVWWKFIWHIAILNGNLVTVSPSRIEIRICVYGFYLCHLYLFVEALRAPSRCYECCDVVCIYSQLYYWISRFSKPSHTSHRIFVFDSTRTHTDARIFEMWSMERISRIIAKRERNWMKLITVTW